MVTATNRAMWLRICAVVGLIAVWAGPVARGERARYVFLMIGDGMGSVQRTAAELFANADTMSTNRPGSIKRLVMNDMPVGGLTYTHSADSLITDSAAAGTALACGQKTDNGVISMDPARRTKLTTIAERTKAAGMKVGIITSVSIDHATPACFYAHQPKRSSYGDIAMQLPQSGFDFFGGAAKPVDRSRGEGQMSPIEAARAAGYAVVTTRAELAAVRSPKVWAFDEPTDSAAAMPYAIDRPGETMSLAELTRKAIELLDNPKGFFIMVEGGKIDWACHQNDAATAVHETLTFDAAVAQAVDFYRKHPNDTLVVVTADHETGGMTLGFAAGGPLKPARLARQTMSHERFGRHVARWRDAGAAFDDALPIIRQAFGYEALSPDELTRIKAAYATSMKPGYRPKKGTADYALYGSRDPLTVTCLRLVGEQAGIGFASFSHTGVPVPTTAMGPGSERLRGYHDNTEIPDHIASAMGLVAAEAAHH